MDIKIILEISKKYLSAIGENFNNILKNPTNILSAMQVIGLAIITVIIPIAIAVFQKKESFEKVDKYVFLDFVIKSKLFLLYIGMVFIPLLLWDILPANYRLLESIVWLIGIGFIIRVIISSYKWMKEYTNIPRLKYLKKLNNVDEMEVVWTSLWAYDDISFNNEIEFFRIFTLKVIKLFSNINKNADILSKLLFGFFNNIKSRTPYFISNDVAFKVFQWDLLIQQAENKEPKNKNNRMTFFKISKPIDRILEVLIKRNLTEGTDYVLFDFLISFLNDNKKDSRYLNRFFNVFYMHFFESFSQLINVSAAWDDYFPEDWKITKKNIEGKDNFFSIKTFERFYVWAQLRIVSPKDSYDVELDEAVKELFPNVEPMIWSKILIFSLSGYDPNNRCLSIINKNWNFGGFRVYPIASDEGIRKIRGEELEETYDLTSILFEQEFTTDKLKNYISELEKIDEFVNSGVEEKRNTLLDIFRNMQSYMINKKL